MAAKSMYHKKVLQASLAAQESNSWRFIYLASMHAPIRLYGVVKSKAAYNDEIYSKWYPTQINKNTFKNIIFYWSLKHVEDSCLTNEKIDDIPLNFFYRKNKF